LLPSFSGIIVKSTLPLLLSITVAAALFAAVAATAAILYYRTMRPGHEWTYNEILEAREEPLRPFYPLFRPIAAVACTVATLMSIANVVLAFKAWRRNYWLFPFFAISFVVASCVLMFWVFYQ
jgi:hypothetical protein